MRKLLLISFFAIMVHPNVNAQKKNLFNGKDLTGWTVYGTEKWYVEDGLLVSESGPDKKFGYLGTIEPYKNFELNLDFKQEADGNSGVFIRSTIEGVKISGWQVEVAQKKDKTTGGIHEIYGRGWLIKPDPEKSEVLKVGDWNHLRIKVKGDQLTSWLNGKKMATITDEKIGEGVGSVALQIHSGGGIKIKWKNIKIKEYK